MLKEENMQFYVLKETTLQQKKQRFQYFFGYLDKGNKLAITISS